MSNVVPAAKNAVDGAVTRLTAYQELKDFSSEDINKAWGLACSFDIYDCNPETIRDAEEIKRFVRELCDLIEMRRFGDTVVVNFGEDERVAGFSMTQLIETSLISAHFANASNTTYLDVFSCKAYDPAVVEEFAMKFFGGSRCVTHVNLRL
ncbi:MAG: S-adenosylmethionine decarboxylase [Candidatus Zixiibacteriota bacterium]|nr:MAG: S-adenosylmethionine decarboxylase [candidate division Zixibacteria bacterium]